MSFAIQALGAVRKTLESVLAGGKPPALELTDAKFDQWCGVFVTLKKHGELRGCIGLIKGVEPLRQALPEMAVAAATHDPRFPPVKLAELKDIDIEISVLSPMEKVTSPDEIVVGRDGLLLQRGGHSGLLLPQVPVEWNWTLDEYLHNLCMKAGLPPGSHLLPDARLMKFSAEVFGEI